jgi:hypothetical protein
MSLMHPVSPRPSTLLHDNRCLTRLWFSHGFMVYTRRIMFSSLSLLLDDGLFGAPPLVSDLSLLSKLTEI